MRAIALAAVPVLSGLALAATAGCRDGGAGRPPRRDAVEDPSRADGGSPVTPPRAMAGDAASPRGMSPEAYDRWRRPEQVIAALDLTEGQTVADVGAGIGYFTVRLAEAVGPHGRVVATDIDGRALSALAELARRAAEVTGASGRAAPIEVRRVEPDDPGLEPGRYDRILLAQVDHLLRDPVDYLRRLRPALAPGGRIAVVNRIHHRAALVRAAAAAGYSIREHTTELPGQFLVLLAPATSAGNRSTERESSP